MGFFNVREAVISNLESAVTGKGLFNKKLPFFSLLFYKTVLLSILTVYAPVFFKSEVVVVTHENSQPFW